MTPERWLSIRTQYGITDRDWTRIKALITTVSDNYIPAALDDLDSPYRIGAVPEDQRDRFSGTVIGVFGGYVVLAWGK